MSDSTKFAAPWRRNAAQPSNDVKKTESEPSYSSKFSTSAPEFVPKLSAAAPEFKPSFLKADAAEFIPSKAVPQSQQSAWQGNCALISLAGYSDDSDDDSQPEAPAPAEEPAKPAARLPPWRRSAAISTKVQEEDSSDPPSSPLRTTSSACTVSTAATMSQSPTCSTASLVEDNDLEDDSEAKPLSPTKETSEIEDSSSGDDVDFTIADLLRLRHSVDPDAGREDGLGAMHVETPAASADEPKVKKQPEKEPKKEAKKENKPEEPSEASNTTSERKASADESSAEKSWRKLNARAQKTTEERDFGNLRPAKGSLKVSENSWVSRQVARRGSKESAESEMSDEDVARKMKGILNKLTIDRFPELSRQLITCGIRTNVHLETLIMEVFQKATTQHHFINMYADLCSLLNSHFAENPITNDPKKGFKKILLNACQASFERHLAPPSSLDKLEGELLAEAELSYKMRMLGNIRFVGALLVRKMLASKVMFAIIEELLGDPTPEALESLASLLTVIGPTFDVPEWPHRVMLAAIFSQVQGIIDKPKTPSRVRCLLQDVLDLRADAWKDRKPKKMEGPSTLEQVAQKFHAESDAAQSQSDWSTKGGSAGSFHRNMLQGFRRKSWGSGIGSTSEREDPTPSSAKSGRINRLATDLFQTSRPTLKSEDDGSAVDSDRRSSKQTTLRKNEKVFDKEACRKEMVGALAELNLSHDLKEAISRISSAAVPTTHQSQELCELLGRIVEETASARKVGFELVRRLFSEGHWKASSLGKGLQDFAELCADLKYDVPTLPSILCEELTPALKPLVQSGSLSSSDLKALLDGL